MEELRELERVVVPEGPVPPQSLDAERAVLCAMLLDVDAVEKAMEILGDRPRDFYREAHRKIYEAIVHLTDRNQRADLITLTEELSRRGELESVGGASYLGGLFEYAATSANVDQHARLVKEKGVLRRLIAASQKIAADAYAGRDETHEIVDRAEQRIFEIADERLAKSFEVIGGLLTSSFQQIQNLYDAKQHVTGVPTGFTDLDDRTAGLQPSDLVVVAGRPAMGKTSFALNLAENAAILHRRRVGIFSLEMSRDQLVQRFLCSQARVDLSKLRRGFLSDRDWKELTRASGRLFEAPIYLDDSAGLSVLEVRTKARRLKAEHGLDFIVIDYLQLMRASDQVENRQQEVSQITRSLKGLAKELEIPVVVLSQLSRAPEQPGRNRIPQLSDLRECVPGDTLVQLADGRRVPIEGLVGTEPEVLSVTEGGRVVRARCDKIWKVGRRPVFEVRLASGRTLRATGKHRLLGWSGWKRVSELRSSDRLAVARTLAEPDRTLSWPDSRVALLGQMIGDGSYLKGQPMGAETTALLGDERIASRAQNDLFWDRVVEVRPAGEEDVYDLTVPGPASWLAGDGIVSHNSGAIEQDADIVLFIYREEVYKPTDENRGKANVIIAKHRNGPTGLVDLTFLKECTRFENYSPIEPEQLS